MASAPEEKLFLGWLDYTEVDAGESGQFTLSPSEQTITRSDQAVKVNLPNSSREDTYVTPEDRRATRGGRAAGTT